MPSVPPTFYAGVDVAITNQGYTYTAYEAFDASCQAIFQEAHLPARGHVRYVYDYSNNVRWTIQEATESGQEAGCSSEGLDTANPFVSTDGRTFAPAQSFLALNSDAEYVPRAAMPSPLSRCVFMPSLLLCWFNKELLHAVCPRRRCRPLDASCRVQRHARGHLPTAARRCSGGKQLHRDVPSGFPICCGTVAQRL